MRASLPFVIAFALLSSSCNSLWYTLGVEKRALLVERVEEARAEQAEAKETFQTTFDAFKELTGHDGGELESLYEKLAGNLDDCKDSAAAVTKRIDKIESVSEDLFAEWTDEIAQISNPDMRRDSEKMKGETERDYQQLVGAMRKAEGRMAPVLTAFNDQVLYLKHNLNARAIASLENQVVEIQGNVANLIEEMQKSIEEADTFIASMK